MSDRSFATLTSLQRHSVEKEWDAWYKEESKKFLPPTQSADSSPTLSLKVVGVGEPMTPQDVDRVKTQIATLSDRYKKQTGPDYDGDGVATSKGAVQWQINRYNAMLKRATYYIVMAGSTGDETICVFAWVKPSCVNYLKGVSKGDPIMLWGRVVDVSFYHISPGADGRLGMVPLLRPVGAKAIAEVGMEECVAGEEAIKQAASPKPPADMSAKSGDDVPTADLEKQAQGKLSSVLSYKANGSNAKAAALLQAIIADYPNTFCARRAKEELESISSK